MLEKLDFRSILIGLVIGFGLLQILPKTTIPTTTNNTEVQTPIDLNDLGVLVDSPTGELSKEIGDRVGDRIGDILETYINKYGVMSVIDTNNTKYLQNE